MPDWLVKILLGVVLNVGLPVAKKLLPWVPIAVWVAIEEILKAVTVSDDPHTVANEFYRKTKECTGIACPADIKRDY